jgi:hypothetical protein
MSVTQLKTQASEPLGKEHEICRGAHFRLLSKGTPERWASARV